MISDVLLVSRNTLGRDIAVGDIHGHFSKLRAALDRVAFDPDRDRLFSVGDLVDRGPECEHALAWLAQPWFFAVQGNHEDYAIRHLRTGQVDIDNWRTYGGGWFLDLPRERQRDFVDAFAVLPVAIEVDTAEGKIGILHADSPVADWQTLSGAFSSHRRRTRTHAQWSRRRLQEDDSRAVAGVRAIVVGHTPVSEPRTLGNVLHIDTAGWQPDGYFTLLDLATLTPL
ncbi:serine/threonine protein phosphatase [Achromobacter sp. KS-M25]|nr:serine/threonine protein phosphatase [Achromobacter aestuarii]